jgi:hypothetical protein
MYNRCPYTRKYSSALYVGQTSCKMYLLLKEVPTAIEVPLLYTGALHYMGVPSTTQLGLYNKCPLQQQVLSTTIGRPFTTHHRLNVELDLQIIWAPCVQLKVPVLNGLRPCTPPPPPLPAFGLKYEGSILVSQDRRHLFVTPPATLSHRCHILQQVPATAISTLYYTGALYNNSCTLLEQEPSTTNR